MSFVREPTDRSKQTQFLGNKVRCALFGRDMLSQTWLSDWTTKWYYTDKNNLAFWYLNLSLPLPPNLKKVIKPFSVSMIKHRFSPLGLHLFICLFPPQDCKQLESKGFFSLFNQWKFTTCILCMYFGKEHTKMRKTTPLFPRNLQFMGGTDYKKG